MNVTRGQVAKNTSGWLIEHLYSNGASTDNYTAAPETLNRFGADGRELASSGIWSGSTTFLIFKRRKPWPIVSLRYLRAPIQSGWGP